MRQAVGSRLVICVLVALLAGCAAWSEGSTAPRGVVLMVGDGMGIATLTAARAERGRRGGIHPPPSAFLRMERAPRSALVKTWSSDQLVTDSAASMTAMVTGEKVPSGAVSARRRSDGSVEQLETLVEIAEARGLATGIVTTTRLTHATPACAYAHELGRDDEIAIARHAVPRPGGPLGDGVEVLLGGGRAIFRPPGGKDVVADMEAAGYTLVSDRAELDAAVAARQLPVLGLFADGHMAFEADRVENAPAQPSLEQMVAAALKMLREHPRGYLLIVEGGRIDHAHHVNNAYRAIVDTLAFDDAVGRVIDEVGNESVVYVTADHDHTMVVSGYPAIETGVFGQAGVDEDGVPYTTLLYANGPSALKDGVAVGDATATTPKRLNRAGVPLKFETHGGMDVPLFVFAPAAHRDDVPATIDNTEIFHRLKAAVLAVP